MDNSNRYLLSIFNRTKSLQLLSLFVFAYFFCAAGLCQKKLTAELCGIIRVFDRAVLNYNSEHGDYPATVKDLLFYLPSARLPIDPRTGQSLKVATVTLSDNDWKKLQAGDEHVSKQFVGKFAVFYSRIKTRCVLFSTDKNGNCPFGRFNNPSLVVEHD